MDPPPWNSQTIGICKGPHDYPVESLFLGGGSPKVKHNFGDVCDRSWGLRSIVDSDGFWLAGWLVNFFCAEAAAPPLAARLCKKSHNISVAGAYSLLLRALYRFPSYSFARTGFRGSTE